MQVKARQQESNENVVAQAMSELLWRDFFRFTSKKYASLSLEKQRSSRASRAGTAAAIPSSAMPQAATAYA